MSLGEAYPEKEGRQRKFPYHSYLSGKAPFKIEGMPVQLANTGTLSRAVMRDILDAAAAIRIVPVSQDTGGMQ